MVMRINETGNSQPAGGVDHLDIVRDGNIAFFQANDPAVADGDGHAVANQAGANIEHGCIGYHQVGPMVLRTPH